MIAKINEGYNCIILYWTSQYVDVINNAITNEYQNLIKKLFRMIRTIYSVICWPYEFLLPQRTTIYKKTTSGQGHAI